MAKFKVLQKYKDLELGEMLEADEEVEMTVKRADEVNLKLAEYGPFLERVKEDEKDDKKKEDSKKEEVKKKTKGE